MKKVLFINFFVLSLLLTFVFVIANDSNPHELSWTHYGVNTSNGQIDLPEEMMVDGNPTNYITLSETIELEVIEGNMTFQSGTKLDCDSLEYDTDPCSLEYSLSTLHTGVNTSNGIIYLEGGTLIGAYPTDYITLSEDTVFETSEEGNKTFLSGTRINCEHDPMYPDPCEPSYELTRDHTGVNTSNGQIYLTSGMLISDFLIFSNYTTLNETTVFETMEAGNKTFQSGAYIDCDDDPDPCKPSYTLNRIHTGVNTINGIIYLEGGMFISDFLIFSNYTTLNETTIIETMEVGNKTFQIGAYIDCEYDPMYPDPCEPSYELTRDHTGVNTSNGQLNLTIGGLISDFLIFLNYTILNETTIIETMEEGNKTFQGGAYIDCDPLPGEPDPCDLD